MSTTTTLERHVTNLVPADPRWSSAPTPSALPTTMLRRGPVVAMRQRETIALGALRERLVVAGERLVVAHDLDGQTWWVPADAVWIDADSTSHPEHPRPTGLASATSRERALVAGLSDRLGWEAVLELERGADLPPVHGLSDEPGDQVMVLDGRLDHDVPTVVVVGRDFVRWAAGSTWDAAAYRALYGDDGNDKLAVDLEEMTRTLVLRGIEVAAVELDTPLLRRAGITRCSVQLVTSNA